MALARSYQGVHLLETEEKWVYCQHVLVSLVYFNLLVTFELRLANSSPVSA